jgi:hypothetical protein
MDTAGMSTITEKWRDMIRFWDPLPDPETLKLLESIFMAGAAAGIVLSRQALVAADQSPDPLSPLMIGAIRAGLGLAE